MTLTGWYLQEGYTVVYERVVSNDVMVFLPNGESLRGFLDEGQRLLVRYGNDSSNKVVYLFDPCGETPREPMAVEAFTIVTASPNPAHYKQFLKRVGRIRLLPVWSEKEVLELRKSMPNAPSEEEVIERFGKYGGIPRSIFSLEQDKVKTKLDAAIENFNFSDLRAYFKLGELPDTEEAHGHGSHKVIHAEVNDQFDSTHLDFNSEYIEDKVLEVGLEQRRREYLHFFSSALKQGITKLLAGKMYDWYVKNSIAEREKALWQKDGVFKKDAVLRQIKEGGWERPVEKVVEFEKMKPGTFVVPSEAGFPAADILLRVEVDQKAYLVAFSATVSTKHDFNLRGLMKRIPDFPWKRQEGENKDLVEAQRDNFRLVWLLPTKEFAESFKPLGASNEVVATWDPVAEMTEKDYSEFAIWRAQRGKKSE